jgi:hypothetical protein
MPQERLSFFHRELPRACPFLSFWLYSLRSSSLRLLKSLKRLYRRKPATLKPALRMMAIKTMLNPLSWSLDNWLTVLQAVSAIAVALTVVVGYVVNKRQAEKIRDFDLRLAEQQERAANAERDLAEVRERQAPRKLPAETFINSLKGKPKGVAHILYHHKDDFEAYNFAVQLWMALTAAGWTVIDQPAPIPPEGPETPQPLRNLPSIARYGGGPGVAISVHTPGAQRPEDGGAVDALVKAFAAANVPATLAGFEGNFPSDFAEIVVGPKP